MPRYEIIHVDEAEMDLCGSCDHLRLQHGRAGCWVDSGSGQCACTIPHNDVQPEHPTPDAGSGA